MIGKGGDVLLTDPHHRFKPWRLSHVMSLSACVRQAREKVIRISRESISDHGCDSCPMQSPNPSMHDHREQDYRPSGDPTQSTLTHTQAQTDWTTDRRKRSNATAWTIERQRRSHEKETDRAMQCIEQEERPIRECYVCSDFCLLMMSSASSLSPALPSLFPADESLMRPPLFLLFVCWPDGTTCSPSLIAH